MSPTIFRPLGRRADSKAGSFLSSADSLYSFRAKVQLKPWSSYSLASVILRFSGRLRSAAVSYLFSRFCKILLLLRIKEEGFRSLRSSTVLL